MAEETTSKRINRNNNMLRILCISILLILFIEIYDWIINIEWIKQKVGIIYINILDSDYRSFLNATWQVQTSIAILTITFITLILGRLDARILGFKLTEVMLLRSNKFQLNYWEKVWLNTLTVVINFFYVAHANLTGVSIIFLISSILTISLLRESLNIVIKPEQYENEIKMYILKGIDKAIDFENSKEVKKTASKESGS
ncbi:hypothetical protein COM99_26470 [Bacillus cereus]|uniref:hypothetical protein n=1 Tax=Bacillus cereus group TaxID=86661 RepID=UPI000BED0E98|nr:MULTISPECIES: hypothetical protein [Bacillus cereus group]MDF3554654.1 hypothetical protein [Bacillus cereus]PEC30704.1 hypothetical protein COM99_26470 [Bacillus cereus]PEY41088.1 hypothetical protein CN347_01890 [Bacillus cereus]PFJ73685.1 hypothetical protein COJ08_24090 [Bacillus cereus]PFP18926.1 hypothetical protein COJ94_29085 [Bacillus cereus]